MVQAWRWDARHTHTPMNPIRVHLGPMPDMLRTILSDLLSQSSDIVIVGESVRHEDSLPKAREEHADVLLTQDRTPAGDNCLDLILAEPPLGIFAVAGDGRSAAGITLLRRRISVESNGRSTIVEAIRQMAEELDSAPTQSDSTGR